MPARVQLNAEDCSYTAHVCDHIRTAECTCIDRPNRNSEYENMWGVSAVPLDWIRRAISLGRVALMPLCENRQFIEL